jgi:hypothetical protein
MWWLRCVVCELQYTATEKKTIKFIYLQQGKDTLSKHAHKITHTGSELYIHH